MKTSKAVLAAGLWAGLSALPMTASAATPAPNGSASAAALQVTVSLQPLKTIADKTVGWSTVTSALQQLQDALCPVTCKLNLQIPTDLPDSLTVNVAQANDKAVLNDKALDVVSGQADSTPIATNWDVLNLDISALQTLLSNFINEGTLTLQSGNLADLQSFLSGLSLNSLDLKLPALADAHFNLLGTVQAKLPGAAKERSQTLDAVSLTNVGKNVLPASMSSQTWVTVDPYHACAVNAEFAAECSAGAPQVSADNTLVSLHLPDLLNSNLNLPALKSTATTLQQLIDLLSKAIADPNNAGSILTGAASSLPPALQGPIGTLGGLLNGVTSQVTGAVGSTISLDALKLWDTRLAATLDALNAVITAVGQLPDLSNLLTSKEDIATAKTTPLVGSGIASNATSTLGSVSVLPIGSTLAGVLNQVIGAAGAANLPLSQVSGDTALLSIDGITSSATAQIGGAAPCTDGRFVCGTSGLRTVSVLGQTIDLDSPKLALGPGQEWRHVVTIPTLGSVTLDVTRGVEQIVADTPTYREVHIAALDVRLINGDYACAAGATNCSDPLAVANLAGANLANNGGGIAALGDNGTVLADVAANATTAAVSLDKEDVHSISSCVGAACLPTTGLFGGSALPAGFVLIAVAISLRMLPNLRMKLRRVR